MIIYSTVIILITINILEIIWLRLHHSHQTAKTTRIAASVIGIIAGVIGAMHGYYEILLQDRVINGVLFDAISGKSFLNLPTSEWTGWPAITFFPNFLVTGIFVILVSLAVIVWSTMFIQRKNGGRSLILLSVLMLLTGGGFIPPLFGIIAGLIGWQIKEK
jgi:hypothetical protein